MPTVSTSGLTNVTEAETGDSAAWDDIGSGPGSGQSTDLPIQGSENRSRRCDNAVKGMSYDNTATIDVSGANTHIGFWIAALQPGLIGVGGIELRLGGGSTPTTSPWSGWTFPAGDYPVSGGWIRIWLDPTVTRDTGAGTLTLTAIRQFGAEFDMGDVGGTSPNIHIDRIDYLANNGGLLIDGTAADFADLVADDQDTSANVYGIIQSRSGVLFCLARVIIGDATATTFTDSDFTLVFSDQTTVSKNFMGVTVDLASASTDVDFTNAIIKSGGTTRLGDLRVFNTSGAFDTSTVTLDNLRRILLSGGCTLATTAISSCGQIDPTNADYGGNIDLDTLSSEYIDTQENVDLSSTSNDFDIICRFAADDWTPLANMALVSHYGGTIATESFRLRLITTGVFNLVVSDGSAETTFASSTQVQLDGLAQWIRARYDHSLGQVDFFYSFDPEDTPVQDISWTALGSPTGTARAIPSLTRPILVGAENDSTPASFLSGQVSFVSIWTDGFAGVTNHGNLICRADWRTGPAFSGFPSTRADDFDGTNLTWETHGTSPTQTTGDNNTTAADLRTSVINSSTSTAAIFWNVNVDPTGELDDMSFTSAGTGHAIELGPNCPTSITLNGHTYSGYAGTDGSTGNEVIYNNSRKSITITVLDGNVPTTREGNGSTTTVVANVNVTVTGLKDNTEVRVYETGTSTVVDGIENATAGSPDARTFTFADAQGDSVDIVIHNINYEYQKIIGYVIPSTAASLPIQQRSDRNYKNP